MPTLTISSYDDILRQMVRTLLKDPIPSRISINVVLESMNDNSCIKWKRRGYSKLGKGILYTMQRAGAANVMLIRREPGVWEDVSNGHERYRRDTDGWFHIENPMNMASGGSWHQIRDTALCQVLDNMELNMDRYIADMIAVME